MYRMSKCPLLPVYLKFVVGCCYCQIPHHAAVAYNYTALVAV